MTDPHAQAAIEALADQLSACADALHARLLRALRPSTPDSTLPAISQRAAQAVFDQEVALRQHANRLYLDAATLAASGLDQYQQQLLTLTVQARHKIDRIDRIKEMVDLAAELITLGGALASGKPERVLAPLEKLKQHLEAL